jgi:hypothetical protein
VAVSEVGGVGDAPAQIEHAAGLDDLEHATDRGRDQRAVEMHDHGLTQQIVVNTGRDAGETGQFGVHESEIRIAPARFGQQPLRCIKASGGKAVRIQPGDLAAAAAADIGGGAILDEEAPDDVLQIDRRRLLVPLLANDDASLS